VSRDRAVNVCRFYVRKRSILIERRDERTRTRNSRFEKNQVSADCGSRTGDARRVHPDGVSGTRRGIEIE